MAKTIVQMREALAAARKAIADVFAEAKDGDLFDYSLVKSIEGDGQAVADWIGTKTLEVEELHKEYEAAVEGAKVAEENARELAHLNEPASKLTHSDGNVTKDDPYAQFKDDFGRPLPSHRILGRLIAQSEAIKGYKKDGNGPLAHVDVDLKTLFETTAGWAPESVRTGRVELDPQRPAPVVINRFPQTTTSQAAIVYMEETTFTNAAAEAAENASYAEAALVLTQRTQTVEKIAVFLPVTDEQFEDEPRAEDYVSNRLLFMIAQRLDLQALQGTGVTPLLLGTENVTGINSQAKGADNIFDATYKAIDLVRTVGFTEPNVIFIHPTDWQPARLAQTADGIYILGNPAIAGPSTLWGVPVAMTTAAPLNSILLGDYAQFAEFALRRGIDVQVTNSHNVDFINGRLAICADMRGAVIYYRPEALAEVTGV